MDSLPLSQETGGIAARPAARGLYRYSLLVVVWCFVQIKLGAMVTSTNSGMAFKTWPHSDGYWLWPLGMDDPKQFFEHVHRLGGAALGSLTIGLLLWVWWADPRRWLRNVMLVILPLVAVQGVVGGVGVLRNLPAVTSVTHGMLAPILLCGLTLVAFCLSRGWSSRVPCAAGSVRMARILTVTAMGMVVLQSFVGAILRHTNNVHSMWIHVAFALVVSLAVLIAAAYCNGRLGDVRGIRRLSKIVLGVLLVQLVLGFMTLAVRNPKLEATTESLGRASVQTAHVVVGASLLLVTTLLAARAFRNVTPIPAAERL